tara:strand:+ start:3006 stop:3215 length:210 start_codon:yes stop_codon:yes gene_type:complete
MKKKNITFNKMISVVLIPSRCEYYGFFDEIWWKDNDLIYFRNSAINEIKSVIINNPEYTVKQAKSFLYF